MREINFITIGDKNFFSLIQFSIKQVSKFYPKAKLFIYDWGFTPSQKKKISTYPNTILIDWTDKLNIEDGHKKMRYKKYERHERIRISRKREYILNQKPLCMLDCAKRIKENLIFFDGDAILINPIDEIYEDYYDIGLTASEKFLTEHEDRWKFIVNSGIIFFTLNSIPMQTFIQEWIKEIKLSNTLLMEQTSLFNLIRKRNREIYIKDDNIVILKLANSKYRIKILPPSIYNFPCIGLKYNDKKVKFLHFISLKRYSQIYQSESIIIRYFIREIQIRHTFNHISKLVSPILLSKVIKSIREILNPFLLFKLLVRPLNFKMLKIYLFSVILTIRRKMKD